MANKKTRALTYDQYKMIITTLREGFLDCKPNIRIATALTLEANLGIRISDVLSLRLANIVRDGDRWRLDIIEQKTGKQRTFTVPEKIYGYIMQYCYDNSIGKTDLIFHRTNNPHVPITERAVQKQLKLACDYLGYEGISTHSFRKFFATEIYRNNDFNIALVQQLLQHSSPAVTQRYIGIDSKAIETALEKHITLL